MISVSWRMVPLPFPERRCAAGLAPHRSTLSGLSDAAPSGRPHAWVAQAPGDRDPGRQQDIARCAGRPAGPGERHGPEPVFGPIRTSATSCIFCHKWFPNRNTITMTRLSRGRARDRGQDQRCPKPGDLRQMPRAIRQLSSGRGFLFRRQCAGRVKVRYVLRARARDAALSLARCPADIPQSSENRLLGNWKLLHKLFENQ